MEYKKYQTLFKSTGIVMGRFVGVKKNFLNVGVAILSIRVGVAKSFFGKSIEIYETNKITKCRKNHEIFISIDSKLHLIKY